MRDGTIDMIISGSDVNGAQIKSAYTFRGQRFDGGCHEGAGNLKRLG